MDGFGGVGGVGGRALASSGRLVESCDIERVGAEELRLEQGVEGLVGFLCVRAKCQLEGRAEREGRTLLSVGLGRRHLPLPLRRRRRTSRQQLVARMQIHPLPIRNEPASQGTRQL